MKHPARIVTPPPHISTKWRLPPMGWAVVYTLTAFMLGVMFYVVKNMLDTANGVL